MSSWPPTPRIGTAAWNLRTDLQHLFPVGGTHLQRYARRFNAVEVNSSFYRVHRVATWQRWAASVPRDFRFAVKLNRALTHETRLADPSLLHEYLVGPLALGDHLGPLLVQLPPSLEHHRTRDTAFFDALAELFPGPVVFEPRHRSWFRRNAQDWIADHGLSLVIADPLPTPEAAVLWHPPPVHYVRLHGSPEIYRSSYRLTAIREALSRCREERPYWLIFDNTTFGAATVNALDAVALANRDC